MILALDASTYSGSVAVIAQGRVVAEGEATMRGEQEERLMPAVADVLRSAQVSPGALSAVACGAGPGSFTSLRIAASIAKGLASSLRVPLWTVSSLALIVAGGRDALPAGRYLAALDAMRGDWYTALYEISSEQGITVAAPPALVPGAELTAHAASAGAAVIGPGQRIDATPHARGVARLLETPSIVLSDLAAWEPDYGRLAEAQVKWEAAHGRPLRVSA